jgi:hypothetical protein
MGTYKVIQDIEADDKLVGPLSLRQFIYACLAAFMGWLSFFAFTKHATFLIALFLPIGLFTGFLAFPWGRDQPTELWALAKLRFFLKPHKRIWDQTGVKDLVTITVPKRVERFLTDGLSQSEVRSRLNVLANTIDSRGWAVKNVNVNMATMTPSYAASDRLVDASTIPQEVANVDVTASDDMLDEKANPVAHQFDAMITQAAANHRQQLITQLQQPHTAAPQSAVTPADYWFLNQPSASAVPDGQAIFASSTVVAPATNDVPAGVPSAATPTAAEEALAAKLKAANEAVSTVTTHLKTIETPEQIATRQAAEQREKARQAAEAAALTAQKAQVTSEKRAAIINLANNDDLNVATIARQAQKAKDEDDGEVVISLR